MSAAAVFFSHYMLGCGSLKCMNGNTWRDYWCGLLREVKGWVSIADMGLMTRLLLLLLLLLLYYITVTISVVGIYYYYYYLVHLLLLLLSAISLFEVRSCFEKHVSLFFFSLFCPDIL